MRCSPRRMRVRARRDVRAAPPAAVTWREPRTERRGRSRPQAAAGAGKDDEQQHRQRELSCGEPLPPLNAAAMMSASSHACAMISSALAAPRTIKPRETAEWRGHTSAAAGRQRRAYGAESRALPRSGHHLEGVSGAVRRRDSSDSGDARRFASTTIQAGNEEAAVADPGGVLADAGCSAAMVGNRNERGPAWHLTQSVRRTGSPKHTW